jgi:septal ring factor EnvC (AmiA/AmiB activator)
MKKLAWKSLAISIGFGVLLTAGCGQNDPPSVKQCRAIAAENMQLQKELERSKARFENLKEQYDKELEKQQTLLDECRSQRDQWKAKSRQNVRDQAESLVDPLMKEITRLREENRKLAAQLQELKK